MGTSSPSPIVDSDSNNMNAPDGAPEPGQQVPAASSGRRRRPPVGPVTGRNDVNNHDSGQQAQPGIQGRRPHSSVDDMNKHDGTPVPGQQMRSGANGRRPHTSRDDMNIPNRAPKPGQQLQPGVSDRRPGTSGDDINIHDVVPAPGQVQSGFHRPPLDSDSNQEESNPKRTNDRGRPTE